MNKYFSKDVGPYSDGKIEWQSVESFWTDFEAQEGIILNVYVHFEAQEGIIWGTGGSYHNLFKTGPFLDHLTVIIKERLWSAKNKKNAGKCKTMLEIPEGDRKWGQLQENAGKRLEKC